MGQSVVAVSLGMVMAATGDLGSLQILRSLRKRADLETSYGVHMATHMAIGFVFLGGGRYTFNQDPLSIATLLMAVFPRFPVTLTDNRCHLQAFRHLYVLAARHHCVEAVEVDTQQPVDVMVSLQSVRGRELVVEKDTSTPAELAQTSSAKLLTIRMSGSTPRAVWSARTTCAWTSVACQHSSRRRDFEWLRDRESLQMATVLEREAFPKPTSSE